jgi:hypothetical protein
VVALVALLGAPVSGPGIVSVTTEPAADGPTAVVILLAGDDVPVTVRRAGARVLVEVPGGPPDPLLVPRPLPPVDRVLSEPGGEGGDRLALEVRPPFEYRIRRWGRELRLLFSVVSGADELETLALMLFPAPARPAPSAFGELAPTRQGPRVRLRPSVSALYAAGANGFDQGPQPDEDSYYDIGPRLEMLSDPLRVAYEAHIRGGSRYPGVNSTTTHDFDARVERQLAGDTHVSLFYNFLRGRQQANAVDPGGEYFYGFEPFRKHNLGARARVPIGGATGLVFAGAWDRLRFDEPGTFTDFSAWTAQGGVRRDIGGQTSLEVFYTRDEVYEATSASVAGTSVDGASVSLTGEVRPLLHVHLFTGLSRRRSPGAPDAARALTDFLARVDVRKEFSGTTALALGYQRSRNISAFEDNPSYFSNFLEARGYAPLPLEISMAASLGFRQNDYPLDATEIGVSRRDRIFGWAVGLGRTLGDHTVLHVEYRWLRRRSNLPGLSSDADGFLVQLDVTPWREGGWR